MSLTLDVMLPGDATVGARQLSCRSELTFNVVSNTFGTERLL